MGPGQPEAEFPPPDSCPGLSPVPSEVPSESVATSVTRWEPGLFCLSLEACASFHCPMGWSCTDHICQAAPTLGPCAAARAAAQVEPRPGRALQVSLTHRKAETPTLGPAPSVT